MNTAKPIIGIALILVCCITLRAQTVDEYVQQAEEKSEAGDIEGAIHVMQESAEAYPDDPTVHAFLGEYLSRSAGASDDMMVKATRSGQAFEHLDRAVDLDSTHVYARFFRGVLSVMVPSFLGKLDQGIGDLKMILRITEEDPKKVPENIVTQTYNYLGIGCSKKERNEEARSSWQEVIHRAPDSDLAKEALMHLDELSTKPAEQSIKREKAGKTAENADVKRARRYMAEGNPKEAIDILKNVLDADSSNALALAYMGLAYAAMASPGYDGRIAEDTDLRSNYTLDGFRMVDEAVTLAPDEPEVRFVRGRVGAELPSFVGKTDQAIEDLNYVIEKTSSEELKSEAMYALGLAYRRKGLSVWEQLITNYPNSEAVRSTYELMKPEESRIELSGDSNPLIVVRFAIGFETELEPQTAVWIEDDQAQWVKTLYVSGFSGHVGKVQVVLPEWAEASDFETDANTGASIAAGWHTYVWDLTDHGGKRLEKGIYTVKVEVHHWPSMQYQLASATVEIGKREKVSKAVAGDLVPFLEVRYVPE